MNALEENRTLLFGVRTKPLLDLFKLSTIKDDERNLLQILQQRGITADQLNKTFSSSSSQKVDENQQKTDSNGNGVGTGTALGKELSGKELEKLKKNLDSFLKMADELTEEEIRN